MDSSSAEQRDLLTKSVVYLDPEGDPEDEERHSLRVEVWMALVKATKGAVGNFLEQVSTYDVYGLMNALTLDNEHLSNGQVVKNLKDEYMKITFHKGEEFLHFYSRWLVTVNRLKQHNAFKSFDRDETLSRLMESVEDAPDNIKRDLRDRIARERSSITAEKALEGIKQLCMNERNYDVNRQRARQR